MFNLNLYLQVVSLVSVVLTGMFNLNLYLQVVSLVSVVLTD